MNSTGNVSPFSGKKIGENLTFLFLQIFAHLIKRVFTQVNYESWTSEMH